MCEKLGCDIFYIVVKNMFVCIVVKEVGIEGFDEFFVGLIVVIFVKGDFIEVVKILCDFVKINKVLIIKGGFVDGIVYDVEGVKKLVDFKFCL